MGDKLRLAYRDHDRTPLLYLIRDQAARFEKLELELLHVPGGNEYRDGFLAGTFDLMCEHFRFLFPARLAGHPIRCLAATELHAIDRLVCRMPIHAPVDLADKVTAVRDQESSRITLKHWLNSLGIADRVTVKIYPDEETGRWQQWRKVISGDADAALCSPLYLEEALAAGLRVADIPALAMIGPLFFATLGPVIAEREDSVRRFMRALYRAIHAFLGDPDYAIAEMRRGPAKLMRIDDLSQIRKQYNVLRNNLAPSPIPRPECIFNTFQMVKEVFDIATLNPLEMWDLRFAIELEEQKFTANLGVRSPMRA